MLKRKFLKNMVRHGCPSPSIAQLNWKLYKPIQFLMPTPCQRTLRENDITIVLGHKVWDHIVLASLISQFLNSKKIKLYVWRMTNFRKLSEVSHPFLTYDKTWQGKNMNYVDYYFKMTVRTPDQI